MITTAAAHTPGKGASSSSHAPPSIGGAFSFVSAAAHGALLSPTRQIIQNLSVFV